MQRHLVVLQHPVGRIVETHIEIKLVRLGRPEVHETLLQILHREVMNRSKEAQHDEHDHLHIDQHALYPLIMDHQKDHHHQGGVICEESHLDHLLQKKLYANKLTLTF